MTDKNLNDIRWKQRFKNFLSAFQRLKNAIDLSNQRPLSELEKQGLIQAFEFTHELSWNVLKDYFDYQGSGELILGPRDAVREAFNKNLIDQGEVWMDMIKSRNLTSHTYNTNVADEISKKILHEYYQAFEKFRLKLKDLSEK